MMRMLKLGCGALLAATVAVSANASNSAYDMVVIHAEGTALQRGAVVDGNAALSLEAGAKITLLGADGKSMTLHGPQTMTPRALAPAEKDKGAADGKVVEILGALLRDDQQSTRALGVVRSAGAQVEEPAPSEWAVSVTQSGTKCIRGDSVVLWRPDARQPAAIQIRKAQSARSARTSWPAGSNYLAVNHAVFQHGQNYAISMGGRTVEIAFRVMPDGLESLAEQATWMARNGCKNQAMTLVERLR